MGTLRKRSPLVLTTQERAELRRICQSRTEKAARVQRAKILLGYSEDQAIAAIARNCGVNRSTVERAIDRAFEVGVVESLNDRPRPGKAPLIRLEARMWVISLACQKPKEWGYSFETWTNRLLAEHVRKNCEAAGHPCLKKLARGTVSKILKKSPAPQGKVLYRKARS